MTKLNRDVAIKTLIDYKDSILKLIDYININDTGYEIPVAFYLNLYNTEIYELARDDAQAMRNLTVDSLVESKIFLEQNKKKGVLILERVVVDLLRFIDINRSKELTRKDFEHMRQQLESAVNIVLATEKGSREYRDAMRTFYEALNSVHSKIRENAERLKVKVDDIAVEYKSLGDRDAKNAFDLFDKVTDIYHQYVLPCFEFLNASNRLVEKENFSDSVDSLILWHEEAGGRYSVVASSIQFSKNAIFSYYKDISEWERKLKQYSNSLEAERRNFIAIEAAFNGLMKEIESLRHGKIRGYKLTPEAEFFKHFTVLDGIESQNTKFQAKLNWQKDTTLRRFGEFHAYLETKAITRPRRIKKRPPPEPNIEDERKDLIANLVFSIDYPNEIPDIHKFLHQNLKVLLTDYSLIDLLYALECIYPEFESQIIWTEFPKREVSYQEYFLEYVPVTFKESELHV